MKDMQKFKNVTQPPSLGRRAELHFLMGSRAAVPVGSWRQNENQRYLGKRSSKCRAWWGQFESLSQALIYQLSITFFLYIAHPFFVWAKIRAETSCETGSPSFPWKWGEINSYDAKQKKMKDWKESCTAYYLHRLMTKGGNPYKSWYFPETMIYNHDASHENRITGVHINKGYRNSAKVNNLRLS